MPLSNNDLQVIAQLLEWAKEHFTDRFGATFCLDLTEENKKLIEACEKYNAPNSPEEWQTPSNYESSDGKYYYIDYLVAGYFVDKIKRILIFQQESTED